MLMKIGRGFWAGLLVGAAATAVAFTVLDHPKLSSAGVGGQPVASPGQSPAPKSAGELASITSELRSALAVSVDGSIYDPAALASDAIKIMGDGFGRAEAVAAVKSLAAAGVAPSLVDRMSATSSSIARATGRDVLGTAQKIADGVTRGYDACASLDNELNFLTADQRSQIRTDFDAGEAAKARMNCFSALEARGNAADAAR
jgi:hypothetical protein